MVFQGYWKWRRSIGHIRLSIGWPFLCCTILELFDVEYSWPWNLSYRSLKIIQTSTIRKLGRGFLFAFYSNYGSMLHHFRDRARYWSEIVIFSYPLAFDAPVVRSVKSEANSAHLVVGPSLSLDQRLGIRCQLTSAIRRVVTSLSDIHWKHSCSLSTSVSSALEVFLRRCAI